MKDDTFVLINSTYDLWKADPNAKVSPIVLTDGEKNNTLFYAVEKDPSGSLVDKQSEILLTAFNLDNKNFGFCKFNPYTGRSVLLSLEARYSGHLQDLYTHFGEEDLIRSSNGKAFLVRREKADSEPNYYFSQDLRYFSALSDIQPHKQFNWLKAELCTYKDQAGNNLQGVLYKPENFDSAKSYPVIFNIYETKSNLLNNFDKPVLAVADFSIPILVSNGYVVFLPDIAGRSKYSGDGALNSVNAAIDFMSNFSWVNTAKLALVGHSFGGFETNYIITHSKRFAAAVSGAGISDMIRLASGIWGDGDSQQSFAQTTYLMMESTLADDPDTYIRNSPILSSKNVTAPLLFMHNDGDGSVNFEQTRSFFIVLRDLNKPCWWINYRGQSHGVSGETNQYDFNKKVWEFLDHYLKDKPMPEWMKEHI
ncbi:alpha/beta hydrolase family protein [Chitinophaga agri]|uniref:S9 family peptidase n=1 Tax=Chitinophaga agri TaxID=2703787 RepID=A0A6B9ZB48_9BACT|nr:prolyl oligopeptidase family serine peptidase [Chitinophaga agri]QHS58335.1 S9 family peptidase [Chitinophaga agri]